MWPSTTADSSSGAQTAVCRWSGEPDRRTTVLVRSPSWQPQTPRDSRPLGR
jgi:hypothetical protein